VHIFVYSLLGYSGNRFIAPVDWITLLFYGIGISYLFSLLIEKYEKKPNVQSYDHVEILGNDPDWSSSKTKPWFLWTGLILFIIGCSLPLVDQAMPSKYTQYKMDIITSRIIESGIELDPILTTSTFPQDQVVQVYGKALYPRFFKAGLRIEDNRKGEIPDFSYDRVEFYLVGTESSWVTLPGIQGREYFPHGSEILLIGTREPKILNIEGEKISDVYIKASTIYFIDNQYVPTDMIILKCSGKQCQ
jgi:hypothetical protein